MDYPSMVSIYLRRPLVRQYRRAVFYFKLCQLFLSLEKFTHFLITISKYKVTLDYR